MQSGSIGKYEIEYTNKEEFHILKKEIFSQNIYSINLKPRKPNILDVGSHIGLSILYFKKLYPKANITGLEPNPILYDILQRNIENNHVENVKTINRALYTKNTTHEFFIDATQNNWFSSGGFYSGSWKGTQDTKCIRIKTITLDSIVKKSSIDLLKLDIEGLELKILNTYQLLLRNIRNLILEYHPISKNHFNKLVKILKNNYNKIIYVQNGKSTNIPDQSNLVIIKASNEK